MLKKIITYTDFNGVEQKEEHYFNFNKAELMDMEMSFNGGFSAKIQEIIKAKNQYQLFQLFKDIVLKAYGVKSEDGKRFIKSDAVRKDFEQSEAFSELLFELCSDPNAAAEFVNGVMSQHIKQLSNN